MKSFHKDGRVRVILKLRLPRTVAEPEECSLFNNFYEKLAEQYISSSEHLPYSTEKGSRPTTVNVDFSQCTDEYLRAHPKLKKRLATSVIIKREMKINVEGQIRRTEQIDIYDTKTSLFIK